MNSIYDSREKTILDSIEENFIRACRKEEKERKQLYPYGNKKLYEIFPADFINKAYIRRCTREINETEIKKCELVLEREKITTGTLECDKGDIEKIYAYYFSHHNIRMCDLYASYKCRDYVPVDCKYGYIYKSCKESKDIYIVSGVHDVAKHLILLGISSDINYLNKKISLLSARRKLLYRAQKEKITGVPILNPREINIDEIKQIPIKDVLDRYGIRIERGNKFLAIWRNDHNPSCDFSEDKNAWCDRANGNDGGSVIDLVMKLENCNTGKAIKILNELL